MGTQEETTTSGRALIPVQLAGRNASYLALRSPTDPAYPRGDEARYSDDYLLRLNREYPLNDLLGERLRRDIRMKDTSTLTRLVMDSLLQNSEGEWTLGRMLISSAEAGVWHPQIIDVPRLTDTQIKTASEYLKAVESISPTYGQGMIDGGTLFGISVAKRGGLALPVEYDSKVMVIPSQKFIEYLTTQIRK